MRIRSLFAVAVVALAVLIGGASVALAKPVPWDSVDLVVHDDNGKQLMILAGSIATETPLPAQVEIAVPAGLQLQWAGEILGGDVANDPAVTPKITKSGASDIYAFTLTKARTAQLELAIPGAVRVDGSKYAAAVTWTPHQELRELKIGFRIPTNAQIATPVPGATEVPGPTGFDYYRSTLTNVKANQPVTFAFDYTVPAMAAGAAGTAGASSSNAATFLVIAGLLAIVAGLVWVISRKMAARNASGAAPSKGSTASRGSAKPAAAATAKSATARAKASGSSSSTKATPSAQGSTGGGSKSRLVLVGVIVALVIGAFLAIQASSKPQVSGDVISRTFSSADPCTSTVVPLAAAPGSDLTDASEKLFAVLQTLPSITSAKIYKDQPRIEVGYCESTLQPGQVEQALSATGLVAKD